MWMPMIVVWMSMIIMGMSVIIMGMSMRIVWMPMSCGKNRIFGIVFIVQVTLETSLPFMTRQFPPPSWRCDWSRLSWQCPWPWECPWELCVWPCPVMEREYIVLYSFQQQWPCVTYPVGWTFFRQRVEAFLWHLNIPMCATIIMETMVIINIYRPFLHLRVLYLSKPNHELIP